MTKSSIDKAMHEAHLRHQRNALRADSADKYVTTLPCSEVRGVKRKPSLQETKSVFKPEWFTGLRPNFWKAYFDTLTYMRQK